MKEEKGRSTPKEAQSRVEVRGGGVLTRPTRPLAAMGEAGKKGKGTGRGRGRGINVSSSNHDDRMFLVSCRRASATA